VLCVLLLTLLVLPAVAGVRGLPMIRHYSSDELPGAPSYSDLTVDAHGVLYAGSGEGVMVLRSGVWELFELPRRGAVYSLQAAPRGGVYVGGASALGLLQVDATGRLVYQDLLPAMAEVDPALALASFYGLKRAGNSIYVRYGSTLYELQQGGRIIPRSIPEGAAQRSYTVGQAVYIRIEGTGLVRMEGPVTEKLPGSEVFAQRSVVGMWAWRDGLLIAAEDGFYHSATAGIVRLASDADAAFARHAPYTGIALADGGFVLSAYDGTLMHYRADLRLADSFMPGASGHVVFGMALDREGGLWMADAGGITQLRLPSPWTVFDQRHGLESHIYDSTWHAGRLWVAGQGLWHWQQGRPGVPSGFVRQPGFDPTWEVFVIQGTAAGLLVGDRLGLAVLEDGSPTPRRLHPPDNHQSVYRLLPAASQPDRILALAGADALWLGLQKGRWQILGRWPLGLGNVTGIHEMAPGEYWLGDGHGGVQRWRLDTATGQLLQRDLLGAADGLPLAAGQGTRLVHMDGALYAISDQQVRRLEGTRFVAAQLPALPGLERPWDLDAAQTAQGNFAWTTRTLWWKRPGASDYQVLPAIRGKVPGYAGLKLHDDGNLRLLARDRMLQLDPDVVIRAPAGQPRLDRLQVIDAEGELFALPLRATQAQRLPPGSGLAVRFGLDTIEPDIEYRYRLDGHDAAWSDWSAEREVSYRRLPPRAYSLELQARIRGGAVAGTAVYPLQVMPFWYQRKTVQALLLVVGVMLVALAIRWRVRAVLARNRQLEQRIAERTRALEVANASLTALAVVDSLTGIANRHALERALERGWQRCLRSSEPLAVVMGDVDHFKVFNDTHGHLAGDAQLQRVAAQFANEVAGVDELAARYGGEEFVLILPGLSLQQAMARAERVRQGVEQALQAAGMPGSISLGVAALVPDGHNSPADVMRRADQALYQAKHAGRNRVVA